MSAEPFSDTTQGDQVPPPADTQAARLDATQARVYLERLCGGMDGLIDLRLIDPETGAVDHSFHRTIDQALAHIASHEGSRRNVYVGCALRRSSASGKKENLLSVRWFWVDVDFHSDEALRTAFEGKLVPLPLPPSLTVWSGGGLHLYWFLEEPFDLTTEEARNQFEHVLKGLADVLGGDRSATDCSRVLRVPGTMNYPDAKKRSEGRTDAECLIEQSADHVYSFEDFADFEMRGAALHQNNQRTAYETETWDGELPEPVQAVADRDPRVRRLLSQAAVDLGYPSGSEADLALASRLVSRGLRGPDIEAALRYRRARVDVHPKRDGYFELTVEKALGSPGKAPAPDGGRSGEPSHQPGGVRNRSDEHLTDLGNALRFARLHGADLRYCSEWRKWLVWNGRYWAQDNDGEAIRRAALAVKEMYVRAAQADDPERRKALASLAQRSENEARLKAMVSIARSVEGIPLTVDALDQSPMLLAVANGTLDLRSGELRPHDRADLITKCIEVAYDPAARSDLWERFLERVVPDPLVRDFVQRAVGYSLTGLTVEQVLFLLWGTGANGKSTFIETLLAMFGDCALKTPSDTLLAKRDTGIPNDVARLRGARLVSAVEMEENRRLAEVRVKELTGGDTIAARYMRGEWFEFRPVCKLWIGTNHKPVVRGTDYAIWRRLRLIPFTFTIPEEERDPHLPEKLRGEKPGVLAWAVAGCLDWQDQGLKAPDAVLMATETYREEQDVLGAFLEECCVLDASCWAAAGDIYAAYKVWCEQNGEKPESQKKLSMRFEERGLTNDRRGHGGKRVWRGIGLRESAQNGDG